MSDSLGDRIKGYERRETGREFLPMLPVYARIDGRSFSRLNDGMERPFDAGFSWFDAQARQPGPWRFRRIEVEWGTHAADMPNAYRKSMQWMFDLP